MQRLAHSFLVANEMQIPNEWVNGAIGALSALAVARAMGWLHLPVIGGHAVTLTAPHQLSGNPANPGATVPSAEAIVNLPHKITLTPQ